MTSGDNDNQARLDGLTRARLSRLASRPVDTSGVASRLRAEMSRHRAADGREAFSFPVWARWAGRGAVAAAVLVVAAFLFVTSQSGSPAYAAPAEMARLHRELVAGQAPMIPVSSIAEAQRAIASQWRAAPTLPDRWDRDVHACCLREVQSRRVACILMEQDDTPITVAVAHEKDLRSPGDPTTVRGGRSFVVRSQDGVAMVMTKQGDRWVCLMAELPEAQLLRIAEEIADSTDPQ